MPKDIIEGRIVTDRSRSRCGVSMLIDFPVTSSSVATLCMGEEGTSGGKP